MNLAECWESIPVGKENAVSYDYLQSRWNISPRAVRSMLADLSRYDNGDNYILIRSSRGAGFYRTDDPVDIAAYKRECRSRALNTFAPMKKINRVLNAIDPAAVNYSMFQNFRAIRMERGMSQSEVCMHVRQTDSRFDVPTLSRIENGWVLPTPQQLRALADVYGCAPSDLLTLGNDSISMYS